MLPDKIIIGCFKYQIIETDEPIIVKGAECSGDINFLTHIIRIKKSNMSEQMKEKVLWHEIVHGLFEYRTIDPEKNSEESTTEELARGLYGLMKSNGLLPGQAKRNEMAVTPFGTVNIPDDIKPGQWVSIAPFKAGD